MLSLNVCSYSTCTFLGFSTPVKWIFCLLFLYFFFVRWYHIYLILCCSILCNHEYNILILTYICNNMNKIVYIFMLLQLGPSTIARNTALARGRRAKQPEVGTDLPWRLAAHYWLHCIFGHSQHFWHRTRDKPLIYRNQSPLIYWYIYASLDHNAWVTAGCQTLSWTNADLSPRNEQELDPNLCVFIEHY